MKKESTRKPSNKTILLNSLINESRKNEAADIVALRKPYYFKGRFNSLDPKAKKQKIKEYYKNEREQIKNDFNDLIKTEPVRCFYARVEWSRSATWGANPHAETFINNSNLGKGSASGYGYDKLSAAICYAVNNNEQAKKIILGAVVRAYCKTGAPLPYGIYKTSKIYLHFDGCGVSTLREILKYCGLKKWEHHETRTSDIITAE